MPKPAERRGQAAAEWIAIVVAVSAVLGGALWVGAPQAARIAGALAPTSPQRAVSDQALVDAVAGSNGALSPLGARAWLRETDPTSAQSRIVAAVAAAIRDQHPNWGDDLRITGAPIRGRRTTSTIRSFGPIEARIITFADERERTRAPSLSARAGAATVNLSWQAAGSLARRIARPLGLAVSAVQLAAGLISGDDALPAGVRAGDIIVCRAAKISVEGGALPPPPGHAGWRVGVLREGRLILDSVAAENPCTAPAGG
jgi:hypothetical protein